MFGYINRAKGVNENLPLSSNYEADAYSLGSAPPSTGKPAQGHIVRATNDRSSGPMAAHNVFREGQDAARPVRMGGPCVLWLDGAFAGDPGLRDGGDHLGPILLSEDDRDHARRERRQRMESTL